MLVQRQLDAPATSAGDPICGLRTVARDKVSCVVHIGASQGGLCGGGRHQERGAAIGSKQPAGSFRPYGFMLHTQAGLEALGWYHEHKDDLRSPEHDWSRGFRAHVSGGGLSRIVTAAQGHGGVRLKRSQAMEEESTMRSLIACIFLLPMLALAQSSLPPPPPKPLPSYAASVVAKSCSTAGNYYPRHSKLLNETGTVVLRYFVEADGELGTVEVERSSGYDRLDMAAQRLLQSCKFAPAMVQGKIARGSATLEVVWRLD